ncbi:MAG: tetratricopeptide repeat protein [Gemmatimonadota bacterium]|nr:tetratricopeptide repeat protein [Gemmatimonadota bacterium]
MRDEFDLGGGPAFGPEFGPEGSPHEPGSVDDYDYRANRRFLAGDFDGAARLLREGVARYPEASNLFVCLGFAELARGEVAWARRAFEESLLLLPGFPDALLGLGESLLRLGERARALRVFELALEEGAEDDEDLLLPMARALLNEGLDERAVRIARLAVDVGPESAEAAALLGFVLRRLALDAEARLWLIRALYLDPRHHEARALLGNLLYEAGERRDALRHFVRLPADAFEDEPTLRRALELERAFRGDEARPRLEALLLRLEELRTGDGPDDRLLGELAAGPPAVTSGQLDLFRAGDDPAPDPGRQGPEDWEDVVAEMCLRSSNPFRTVQQYMRDAASRIRARTGIAIPHDDPREFLQASARAGALNIPD